MLAEILSLAPAPPPGARPVPPRRWHLTLAFYGELDEAAAGRLSQVLAARIAHRCVRLRVRGGGVFRGGAAHLSVAGDTAVDEAALRDLATVCRRAGLACGAPGARPGERFRPHLTVARFRGAARAPQAYLEALRAVTAGSWTCSEVHLVESFLGPDPWYQVRRRFPLVL